MADRELKRRKLTEVEITRVKDMTSFFSLTLKRRGKTKSPRGGRSKGRVTHGRSIKE